MRSAPPRLFLKPYPRDYREGLYKFKSTPSNLPPTDEDLMRTVQEGVPGTAMPSFKLLAASGTRGIGGICEVLEPARADGIGA